jgi:hypothetical protein
VYIADTYNNKVKTYNLVTKECVTSIGSGDPTDLWEPGGLSVWAGSVVTRLYIADTNNHSIVCAEIGPEGKLLLPPTRVPIK